MKTIVTLLVLVLGCSAVAHGADNPFVTLFKRSAKYATNVDTKGKVVCACQDVGQDQGHVGYLRHQVISCGSGTCLRAYCQVQIYDAQGEPFGSGSCSSFETFAK